MASHQAYSSNSPAVLLCGSLYLPLLNFSQVSSHRCSALSQMPFFSEFGRAQADWHHLEHRGHGGEVVLHAMAFNWTLGIDQLKTTCNCCLPNKKGCAMYLTT
jgi:hypothetical protein